MATNEPSPSLPVEVDGVAVRGVVAAVPRHEVANDAFVERFGAEAVRDVVKMIGVQTRRIAPETQTAADLCQAAAERLCADLGWARDSVDALIFVTQTPDYTLPASACALQARLGLKRACAAFDVNLGCSGYVYGLWLASRLLDGRAVKRVLLLAGETTSKITNPDDRATALLFGDAGSATALEFDAAAPRAHYLLGTDGNGERHLIIPAGRFRPYTGDDPRFEGRDPGCTYMDGGEIFNFTLGSVPRLVEDLLVAAGRQRSDVDAYLFHQANTFMIRHLGKKAKLDPARVPMNIERFGNTSSASIPLLLAESCERALAAPMTLALFGFGVGYSWAAGLLPMPRLGACRLIET